MLAAESKGCFKNASLQMNPPPPPPYTHTHAHIHNNSSDQTIKLLSKSQNQKKTETHFPRNVATLWVDAYHKDLNGMKG